MKKLLAMLIAGSFASGVFAVETTTPVSSDVVATAPVKEDASAPKTKKHHHAKKKHHAMKKSVASEAK